MANGTWRTRLADDLVKLQNAIDLGGNGYPIEYTAMAAHIIPRIRDEPPEAKAVWSFDAGDIIMPQWLGKTTKDPQTMAACSP